MDETAPRTIQEMESLPEFAFGTERHELSERDKANGFIVIHGKKIATTASAIEIPVVPKVMSSMFEDGQPQGYTDADGVCWAIGRYADGRWFRRRQEGQY